MKPYLLSISMGVPLFGIWFHRYIHVKKSHKLKFIKFLGITVVWVSYKRIKGSLYNASVE